MSDVTVFHNQACSKSRGALEILDEQGVELRRRASTSTRRPTATTLERILDAISDEPQALVRTDDAKFKALGIPKADVHDARAGDRRAARAPRGDAAPGGVRRRHAP